MDQEDYDRIFAVARDDLREIFEGGEKLALLDCILLCDENNLSLPKWAVNELANAAKKYLERTSETFHDAIFGARRKRGRHSHHATARRESHQLWFDVVSALKARGYKGDRLYDQAHEILTKVRLTPYGTIEYIRDDQEHKAPEPETIKKRYETMNGDGVQPSGFAKWVLLIAGIDTVETPFST